MVKLSTHKNVFIKGNEVKGGLSQTLHWVFLQNENVSFQSYIK